MIIQGKNNDVLALYPENYFHACVTDPPYGFHFMGKQWDSFGSGTGTRALDTPGGARPGSMNAGHYDHHRNLEYQEAMRVSFAAVWRVLKPGGYLLTFGGPRTFHRLTCAVEDAGFEIRDAVCWLFGEGFPKSHNIGKALDKAAGVERVKGNIRTDGRGKWDLKMAREKGGGDTGVGHADGSKQTYQETLATTPEAQQWNGWGTALKPGWEPIILARKPFPGTVAGNVLAHGVGGINIDGCRIPTGETLKGGGGALWSHYRDGTEDRAAPRINAGQGRWPVNVAHDGGPEVMEVFQAVGDRKGASSNSRGHTGAFDFGTHGVQPGYGDDGSPARFFHRFMYCAKARRPDRSEGVESKDGNNHPTVKPTPLMRWLCRLVTPPGGIVLDPFAGSGTTGKAAILEGFQFVGVEQEPAHCEIARARLAHAHTKINLTGVR